MTDGFSGWPCKVGHYLIEPATGEVRIRRPQRKPIIVAAEKARRLASCSRTSLGWVLGRAAREAERQERVLDELRGEA